MFLIPVATTIAVTVAKVGLIKAGLVAGTIIYNVCKKIKEDTKWLLQFPGSQLQLLELMP